jgi:hypothetical protein
VLKLQDYFYRQTEGYISIDVDRNSSGGLSIHFESPVETSFD